MASFIGLDDLQFLDLSAMPNSEAASHSFCSDASGTWGCGAAWHKQWLQLQWPQSWQSINIAVKELVPVVLAVGGYMGLSLVSREG